MTDDLENHDAPCERKPSNGVYRGRLAVRMAAPGVSGCDPDDLDRRSRCSNTGCLRPRVFKSRYCAICNTARIPVQRKRSPVCSICGGIGHDRRTCNPTKWPDHYRRLWR